MKLFLIVFSLLLPISLNSQDVERRALQTVKEIDNFEFAIYGIRKYIEELDKEELFLKESAESFSLFSNFLWEIISHYEELLKSSLKSFLLFHFSSRRMFPLDMKRYETWRIIERMEIKASKEISEDLITWAQMEVVLDKMESETNILLREITDLKDEKEYIKLMAISALTKRADILRILRTEENIRNVYRKKIDEKLGELSERLKSVEFPQFLYPLPGSKAIDTKEVEGGWFIETSRGTPVMAVRTGKVVYAGWLTGYGNTVIIQHEGYYSIYAHLDDVLVAKDEFVFSGDEIGNVGDTGSIYGIGLYFEIRYGKEKMNLKEIYKNFKGGER